MTSQQIQQEYNFTEDIAQPIQPIKSIKSNRTKFIKDLNYRTLLQYRQQRSSKCLQQFKSKQYVYKRERSRNNIDNHPLSTLMQKVIPNAKIIKAQWKQNRLHGNVQIQYDNGNTFIGKYQNGVRVEGKLTFYQQKCTYQGQFFVQKFSGLGKLSYQGGRSIQGQWDNMSIIGNATINYPNKDVYYGPVNQKLYKHGQGYLFLHNGYKYVGAFENGSINGLGTYFLNDKLLVKGLWQKGKLIKQHSAAQMHEQDLQTQLGHSQISTKSLAKTFSYRFHDQNSCNFQYLKSQQTSQDKLTKQQFSVGL